MSQALRRRNFHDILRRPVLTEKTTHAIEVHNAYTFEVAPNANKSLIRRAVEDLFDVKVTKVNVRIREGKRKRVGRHVGFGKSVKEAIVTLKAGDKIDVY